MFELDLVLSLPTELSVSIVAKWLPMKYVAVLDSAYCHRSSRVMFLNLLQAPGCVVPNDFLIANTLVYQYVALRKLKVSNLRIRNEIELDLVENVLELSGGSAEAMTVLDPYVNNSLALYLVAKHCSNLIMLLLDRCVLDFSFRNILQRNLNIRVLYLRNIAELKASRVPNVKCLCLQNLSLERCSFDDAVLTELLRISDGNLSCLNLSGCSVSLIEVENIGNLCPQLYTLFVKTYSRIGRALVTVSEKCALIRNLELSGVHFLDGNLQQIFSNLKALCKLRLTEIVRLYDSDLEQLGEIHGDTLTHLSIHHCPSYTAQGMCVLLEACPELEQLYLHSEMEQITPKVIKNLRYTFVDILYISSPSSTDVKLEICQCAYNFTIIGIHCACPVGEIAGIAKEGYDLKKLYLSGVDEATVGEVRAVNVNLEVVVTDSFPDIAFENCF